MKLIKQLKKTTLILAMVWLGLSSCKEGEDAKDKTLTVDEAKTAVQQMAQDIETDIISMVQSEGIESINESIDFFFAFDSYRLVEGKGPVHVKKMIEDLKGVGKSFAPMARLQKDDEQEDEGDWEFSFQDYLGIYEWNSTTGNFELRDEEVDYVEMRFPAEGSSTNNTSLLISDLQETDYTVSLLDADLKVDGELMASIDFNASFTEVDIVENLSLNLYLKPFTYQININDSEDLLSTVAVNLKNGEEQMASMNYEITYLDEDKMEPSIIVSSIGYGDMEIAGTTDAVGVESADIETVNDYIDLKLYNDGVLIGDIEVVWTTYEDELGDYSTFEVEDVLVIYSDGTSDSLLDLLGTVLDDIEETLIELEGV